jgi:sucrose-6-phosphate hydrolase SacC (GH32 family)
MVDRSSVDVYAADGLVQLTALVLPGEQDGAVRLFSSNGASTFAEVRINTMSATW